MYSNLGNSILLNRLIRYSLGLDLLVSIDATPGYFPATFAGVFVTSWVWSKNLCCLASQLSEFNLFLVQKKK